MSMPFYTSPEQVIADKLEFAQKGVSRGKSIVALEYVDGVLLVASNASSLFKLGEVYDRIGFAGTGKFSEFDQLRKIGVRFADSKGYAYSREDVRAKGLADEFSRLVGDIFAHETKPLEVELLVVEIGDDRYDDHKKNSLYKIRYDGFVSDHSGYCVIGGDIAAVESKLDAEYFGEPSLRDAVRLASDALDTTDLEVCVLDRDGTGRRFTRLDDSRVQGFLGE